VALFCPHTCPVLSTDSIFLIITVLIMTNHGRKMLSLC
jgi:hypothetical protein